MYTLLTIEPPTNPAGLWTFGILVVSALVLAIWFIVHGGKKEEESREEAQEREQNELRVVHKNPEPDKKVMKLDEHETAIGGDYPNVSGDQKN